MTQPSDRLLFEQSYRGERWRFQLSSYGGRLRLNCRVCYQAAEGDWRPCGKSSGKGSTLPLERAEELALVPREKGRCRLTWRNFRQRRNVRSGSKEDIG